MSTSADFRSWIKHCKNTTAAAAADAADAVGQLCSDNHSEVKVHTCRRTGPRRAIQPPMLSAKQYWSVECDNKTFTVPAPILYMSRTVRFLMELQHGFVEHRTKTVNLSHIPAHVMERILQYCFEYYFETWSSMRPLEHEHFHQQDMRDNSHDLQLQTPSDQHDSEATAAAATDDIKGLDADIEPHADPDQLTPFTIASYEPTHTMTPTIVSGIDFRNPLRRSHVNKTITVARTKTAVTKSNPPGPGRGSTDSNFIDSLLTLQFPIGDHEVVDIVAASHYLRIKPLFSLASRKLADSITNNTVAPEVLMNLQSDIFIEVASKLKPLTLLTWEFGMEKRGFSFETVPIWRSHLGRLCGGRLPIRVDAEFERPNRSTRTARFDFGGDNGMMPITTTTQSSDDDDKKEEVHNANEVKLMLVDDITSVPAAIPAIESTELGNASDMKVSTPSVSPAVSREVSAEQHMANTAATCNDAHTLRMAYLEARLQKIVDVAYGSTRQQLERFFKQCGHLISSHIMRPWVTRLMPVGDYLSYLPNLTKLRLHRMTCGKDHVLHLPKPRTKATVLERKVHKYEYVPIDQTDEKKGCTSIAVHLLQVSKYMLRPTCQVTMLDLSGCHLENEGAKLVESWMLVESCKLEKLNVSHNHLTMHGLLSLLAGAAASGTLEYLDASYNHIYGTKYVVVLLYVCVYVFAAVIVSSLVAD
jgi:hypothetical protein